MLRPSEFALSLSPTVPLHANVSRTPTARLLGGAACQAATAGARLESANFDL